MGASATQPPGVWNHSGFAMNGGAAVVIPNAGTYVTVATGLNNRALCYVKLQNLSGGVSMCVVRDADEAGSWDHTRQGESGGVARLSLANDAYGAIVVECNASGDIEITAIANGHDWKLWLMGYMPSI